ncbi:MAG: hypothetical protein M3Y56_17170, partial [Armatimonadota bacterium]|nr:hypothetical protein [Armatimonadota bacterium]
MVRSKTKLLCMALLLLALQSGARADGPWTLTIDAADYAREQVFDPEHHKLAVPADSLALIEVRTKHHLTGEGWYDYDFSVPETGWYTISIKGGGSAGDHDFFVDGDVHIYGGV